MGDVKDGRQGEEEPYGLTKSEMHKLLCPQDNLKMKQQEWDEIQQYKVQGHAYRCYYNRNPRCVQKTSDHL